VLKGFYFAERLYGGLDRRPQHDLDVLVRPRCFRRTLATLHALGFVRRQRDLHTIAVRRGDVQVDVHRHLRWAPAFAVDEAALWRTALEAVCNGAESLDLELRHHSDIEPARLDPVEHAILQLGLWELMSQSDSPYKVVINEAVGLARRFGATDGYRYVNAVLDKASRGHRAIERGEVA
jgi:N utilization substance protein B